MTAKQDIRAAIDELKNLLVIEKNMQSVSILQGAIRRLEAALVALA